MRSSLSHNWVSALPKIVKALNATPLKKLGFLSPDSVTSEESSVFIDVLQQIFSLIGVTGRGDVGVLNDFEGDFAG